MSNGSQFKELQNLFDNPDDIETVETGDDEMPEFHAPVLHKKGTSLESKSQDEIDDFNYVRNSYLSMIERGQISIEVAIRELKLSGHPRAAEVVGALIKNISEVSDRLLDLHNKVGGKESGANPQATTQNNTQNNTTVFMGTPAQMLELYEKQRKEAEKNNEGEILDAEVEELNDADISKRKDGD